MQRAGSSSWVSHRAGGSRPYFVAKHRCTLAYATSGIRLLTSVLVLPHRQPVLAAKMLATVDVLSKGRLTVGVGVDWMSEEIALVGGPPFAERAQASEEYIQAVSENYGRPRSRFNKDRTRLSTSCYPLRNRRSYRMRQFGLGERWRVRVGARVGSAMAGTPSLPILAFPSILRSFMARRLRKCVPRRKGPVAILVRLWAQFSPFTGVSEPSSKVARAADSRSREVSKRSLTISAVDDIGHFQERGLQHRVIGGEGKDLQGTVELLVQFASEVMAKCD
jgi:hypothetical protein